MFSRISVALAAACAVFGPIGAGALSAQETRAGITLEHQAACDGLAAIVIDDARTPAQVDTLMATFAAAMKPGDDSLGDLDAEYPGLTNKVIANLRPIFLRSVQSAKPLYRRDLSALYCAELTLAETREAQAEFSKPAFRSFIDRAVQSVSYEGLVKDAIAEKDASAATIQSEYRAVGRRMAKDSTPQERAALMTFLASPTGRKLAALTPKKAAIDAKWVNYSTPEIEQEIHASVIETAVSHIALTNKELADQMRASMMAAKAKSAH